MNEFLASGRLTKVSALLMSYLVSGGAVTPVDPGSGGAEGRWTVERNQRMARDTVIEADFAFQRFQRATSAHSDLSRNPARFWLRWVF
jgi:hypothetical protein